MDRTILEAEDEARERRQHPRGSRLTIWPVAALNIGQDDFTDDQPQTKENT